MSGLCEGREPVEELAESFLARFRRGERPSLTEYTDRHPELADEIRDLFPALVEMEQLGSLSASAVEATASSPAAGRGPEQLGDFRIIREVGRGGMGVVYEAVQESLGRHVALKILPAGARLTATQIHRFRLEARSAGRLHHGSIVPVHGVGEYQGVHYYAMQFINGHGLDAILEDLRRLRGPADAAATPGPDGEAACRVGGPDGSLAVARSLVIGSFGQAAASDGETVVLGSPEAGDTPAVQSAPQPSTAPDGPGDFQAPPDGADPGSLDASARSLAAESRYFRSVARIGLQVAEALAYAHGQGVLHRDIKPSNLLLDVAGHIWVTDFGLAKVEGSNGPTRTGDIVGTVRYMAPERFDGWSDRRSDVYSLGATLYELLTLRPLFPGVAQAELLDKVLRAAPEPPRKLDPKIPRDLETIVLKAIAKEPRERYTTAEAMGEDLRRFLEDRPILARRSTPVEQFWRFCRRNPGLAAANITAAALITILAIGGTAAALIYRQQVDRIARDNLTIKESERLERAARKEASEQLFESLLAQARATRYSRREGQRFRSLKALRRAAPLALALNLSSGRFDELRDEAIACLTLPDLAPGPRDIPRPEGVILSTFDATMTRYALRFRDGTIRVRRVDDDEEVAHFRSRGERDIFVFGFSPDGRYLATTDFPGFALTVWDVDRRSVAVHDPGPIAWGAARFAPDSRRMAVVHEDGELLMYDLATGRIGRRWRERSPSELAFSPDGTRIAMLEQDRGGACLSVRLIEAESGRLVRSIPIPNLPLVSVVWSPDAHSLATPSKDSKIYLWDAVTGARKATLEGHTNEGLSATFHPSGALLASDGWEARLRLWEPVLGRAILTVAGSSSPGGFSRDGRIVVDRDDRLITYQVDPASEYRTLARFSDEPIYYERVSVRDDGRILAAGTSRGVSLFDLARGTELAFLPIGEARHLMFEASGDLVTSGSAGVKRWPIRGDADRGTSRIGPPSSLSLPGGFCGIDEDRPGRIAAKAYQSSAYVLAAGRMSSFGPMDDVRSVAVSPDGEWLAAGSHHRGAAVWRIRDRVRVADLPIETGTRVLFSPDGRWLMTRHPPCTLWAVGTWQPGRTIGGSGMTFSPDGRCLIVQDSSKILRLVETATGRTLARLESPDLCLVEGAAFSPDGSRLAVTTNDGPAVHVWDLRAIRRHLAFMGLDWDAPAYSADDPADPSAPPLPPLQVDLGELSGHIQHFTEPSEALLKRYTARLKEAPDDAEAYHHRAHALASLNRLEDAAEDLTRAIRLRPDDAHARVFRARIHLTFDRYRPAITDLEAALAVEPDKPIIREMLADGCNNLAWELANAPGPRREVDRALALIRRALAVAPTPGTFLNTLGVIQYRAGRYAEAIATLERSLAAGGGQTDGFDLFFLAMAHHRLGQTDQARACYDRAVKWLDGQGTLGARYAKELAAFRAEAEGVLTGTADELPDDVFADPR